MTEKNTNQESRGLTSQFRHPRVPITLPPAQSPAQILQVTTCVCHLLAGPWHIPHITGAAAPKATLTVGLGFGDASWVTPWGNRGEGGRHGCKVSFPQAGAGGGRSGEQASAEGLYGGTTLCEQRKRDRHHIDDVMGDRHSSGGL